MYVVPNAIKMRHQEHDYDCWYAAILMMLDYHNRQAPPDSFFERRRFIGAMKESYSRFVHRETLLPPTATDDFPTVEPATPTRLVAEPPRFDEADAMAVTGELSLVAIMKHDDVAPSAYKPGDLERLLRNHGPMVAGLAKPSGGGHMVLVKGIYDSNVICNDPDPSGLFSNIVTPISNGTQGEDALIDFGALVNHLSYFLAVVEPGSKWAGNLGRWRCEAKDVGW